MYITYLTCIKLYCTVTSANLHKIFKIARFNVHKNVHAHDKKWTHATELASYDGINVPDEIDQMDVNSKIKLNDQWDQQMINQWESRKCQFAQNGHFATWCKSRNSQKSRDQLKSFFLCWPAYQLMLKWLQTITSSSHVTFPRPIRIQF